MFTLNTNDKLGMMVEDVRLSEIRQAVHAQQLGDAVKNTTPEHEKRSMGGWLNRVRDLLAARADSLEPGEVLRGKG